VWWEARGAGALTLRVTKKYSPGESCRKRTPVEATGASKNLTSWLAYAKQSRMQAPTAPTLTKTRWRSSSRWSHTLISTSSGSSSLSGNRNVCSGDAASRSRRVVAGRYVSSQKSGGSSAPPTTSAAEADTARGPSAQETHRGASPVRTRIAKGTRERMFIYLHHKERGCDTPLSNFPGLATSKTVML
jgi:hypothetical protein